MGAAISGQGGAETSSSWGAAFSATRHPGGRSPFALNDHPLCQLYRVGHQRSARRRKILHRQTYRQVDMKNGASGEHSGEG